MAEINFTKTDLDKLKSLYKYAIDNELEVFIYDGQEILTDYAKYLIEFLDSKFA